MVTSFWILSSLLFCSLTSFGGMGICPRPILVTVSLPLQTSALIRLISDTVLAILAVSFNLLAIFMVAEAIVLPEDVAPHAW